MSSQPPAEPLKTADEAHDSNSKPSKEEPTPSTASPSQPNATAKAPAATAAAAAKPKQAIRLKPNNPIAKIKRPLAAKNKQGRPLRCMQWRCMQRHAQQRHTLSCIAGAGAAGDAGDAAAKTSKYLEEMQRYKNMSCRGDHTDGPLVK